METSEMTKSRLLETMRAILVEERDAIRRFDAVEMERASDAKEAVLAELHAVPFADRGPLIEALAELRPELRHNLILFVHAAAAIAEAKRRTRAPQKLAS
jgi:hypothetical protein